MTRTQTLIAVLFAAVFSFGLIPQTANAQKAPDAKAKASTAKKKTTDSKKKTTATKKKTAKKPAKKTAAKKPTSVCQGLTKTSCGGKSTTCTWVDATTRKDGVKVKAYCRKKAKPGTAATKAPAKKAAAKKTSAAKKKSTKSASAKPKKKPTKTKKEN